jgi:hypothetical protein
LIGGGGGFRSVAIFLRRACVMDNKKVESKSIYPSFGDAVAIALLAAVTAALWNYATGYAALSNAHPYIVSFFNFALLSTFGEAMGARLSGQGWRLKKLLWRALAWGIIGIWVAAAFPFQYSGVAALTENGIWPDFSQAFSTSLWANLLSGYAFFMMLTQYWMNNLINRGWSEPWSIFQDEQFVPWARTILLSLILFWLPAHTATFMLPDGWRTLFAAYLGIALGLILTLAKRPSIETASTSDSKVEASPATDAHTPDETFDDVKTTLL